MNKGKNEGVEERVIPPKVEVLEYKLIDRDPAEPIEEALIEKTGIKVRFSLSDVIAIHGKLEKIHKELEGERMVEDAKAKNIETYHPYVLKFSPEELLTIHMYQEALAFVKGADKQIEDNKAALARNEAEQKAIREVLGPDAEVKSKAVDLTPKP